MFEIALDEKAHKAQVECGPELVRIVMPPSMDLAEALDQVQDELHHSIVCELTEIFGSRLCKREFEVVDGRLVIRRERLPRATDEAV